MTRRLCIRTLCALLALAPALLAQQTTSHGTTVPAGTALMVRLLSELSTRQRAGEHFEAVLQEDVHVGNTVVMHAGTPLYGRITRSEGGKKVGKQRLAATLTDIKLNGRMIPIVTDTAGASEKYGGGLAMVGGGSLVGAVIGGGAGAVVGGVAGAVGSAASKDRHITVPAGRIAKVHLRAPLTVP
jgi:hypothetical protein